MKPELFDRIAQRAATRRGALGLAAALAAAATGRSASRSGAASDVAAEGSFSRDCDRFLLIGENKRKGEWDNVDDNLKVELFRKGSKRSEIIWDDTSDTQVNFEGKPFRIKEFDANVGDKLQISAFNVDGACELDEIWLFCADGGRGKKIKSAFESTTDSSKCPGSGMFYQVRFRIKP
jgi:hypothetical protein